MVFVDGLGRTASALVQRDYLAAASLRAPWCHCERLAVIASAAKQTPSLRKSRHCERSEAISRLLRRFAPRSDEMCAVTDY